MAGKIFSNWNQLEVFLKEQINSSLDKELAKHVKEEIQTAISTEVYGAGTPVVYVRRGSNSYGGMGNPEGTGSLADINQMNHMVNNGELLVTDDAKRNMSYKFAGIGYDISKSLTENIVSGYGDENRWYNRPRPFMDVAIENMKTSKSHIEVMKEALEDRLGKGTVI